ncbi:unnamed protein product [Vitrella brassicaformis CCMP3155]|uniref:THIF-type NAD/FAD binding fold domain-containing protein n=2 Tax=Vitrella brassicaformis TaxID=1169539 RepID=A0A0G4GLI4_VITBC|nr:unnamed protein product [Vitrella brassicaformis CCMP3155]|eukprot:CEM30977.1 unnamed protein product [Vitrella brassicaformis CCMP3155]
MALSEHETKIYDRQLRLWGVGGQQRIKESHLLVIGLTAVNLEACKNLILAGVKVTLWDNRAAQEEDLGYNYFLRQDDINQQKRLDVASQPRLQELNPLSTVALYRGAGCDDSPWCLFEDGPAVDWQKFLEPYTIVCVANELVALQALVPLDEACRQFDKGFFATLCCGKLAFFVFDLKTLFIEKVTTFDESEKPKKTDKTNTATANFPPIAHTIKCKLGSLKRRSSSLFPAYLLLARWQATHGTHNRERGEIGNASTRVAECDNFVAFAKETLREEGGKDVDDDLLRRVYRAFGIPLISVAAVVGGLVAQEVMKSILKERIPFVNVVAFDSDTTTAYYQCIPHSQSAVIEHTVTTDAAMRT